MKFIKYDVTDCAIIGDIHAALNNLDRILNLVEVHKRKRLITVGDIWDRGVEPNETIDILYDLYKKGILLPIVGNHDNKFIRYFTEGNSKVSMGSQQQETLKLITNESIAKFIEIFEDNIVCVFDPNNKIFISHGPGGRPQRILYKNYEHNRIVVGGQPNITFDEFLSLDSHNVNKKHISTLLYGITNGDKNEDGFPVRLPIILDEKDDLDGWTYLYGHIHAKTFNPELNAKCICLDLCSPTGKIGGCIVDGKDQFRLFA